MDTTENACHPTGAETVVEHDGYGEWEHDAEHRWCRVNLGAEGGWGPWVDFGGPTLGHLTPEEREEWVRAAVALLAEEEVSPEDVERRRQVSANLRAAWAAEDAARDAAALFGTAGFAAHDLRGLDAVEPVEWLAEGVLALDTTAMLYGASGVGKSFVALDLALAVATGRGALVGTYPVPAPGPVVYVAAEGVHGVRLRVEAWAARHRVAIHGGGTHPLVTVDEAVNLGDPGAVERFAAAVGEVGAVLVVFDTLARCTVGSDENSATDAGKVVAALDRVRRASGACVLAVHHAGKGGDERGSSALRGAMDTVLKVTGGGGALRLKVDKQKDGEDGAEVALALEPSAGSVVVVPAFGAAAGRGPATVLEALRRIAGPEGVSTAAWQEACGMRKADFLEHRRNLVSSGLAENVGTQRQPRYVAV